MCVEEEIKIIMEPHEYRSKFNLFRWVRTEYFVYQSIAEVLYLNETLTFDSAHVFVVLLCR